MLICYSKFDNANHSNKIECKIKSTIHIEMYLSILEENFGVALRNPCYIQKLLVGIEILKPSYDESYPFQIIQTHSKYCFQIEENRIK